MSASEPPATGSLLDASTDVPAPTAPTSTERAPGAGPGGYYKSLWDELHADDSGNSKEWLCSYFGDASDAKDGPVLATRGTEDAGADADADADADSATPATPVQDPAHADGAAFRTLRDLFRAYVPFEASIVNLGCGTSSLQCDLYDDGYRNVTSVDISETAVDTFRARDAATRPTLRYAVGDVTRLPIDAGCGDGAFDVAIDKCTMDALCESSDHESMLHEAARVVKANGLFIQLSFAFHRRKWLEERVGAHEWTVRPYVLGGGDPLDGHAVVFAYVCGSEAAFTEPVAPRDGGGGGRAFTRPPYNPDALTQEVMSRESLFDDSVAKKAGVVGVGDLFGDSSSSEEDE